MEQVIDSDPGAAVQAIAQAIELAGGPAAVARGLGGISVQAVCFYRDGKRQMPADLMAELERLCGQRLRRWHFRPRDWHRVWPELVGADGAPEMPGRQMAAAG